MNRPGGATAPQHPTSANLEVSGIAALTLGIGMLLLGVSTFGVVLLVLSAGLISVSRCRARGWSAERLGVTVAVCLGAILLVSVGWAVGRLVGLLIVAMVAWFAWHVDVRRRVGRL